MTTNDRTTEYDAQRLMLIVIVALTPCFMMGVYVFGLDMLDNMLGGCGLAVLLSFIMGKFSDARRSRLGPTDAPSPASATSGTTANAGRQGEIAASTPETAVAASGKNRSAASSPAVKPDREPEYLAAMITGAIVVFGTPSTLPIWMILIGVAIAMIPAGFIVKCLQNADANWGQGKNGIANCVTNWGQGQIGDTKIALTPIGYRLLERAMVSAAAAQAALWALFREEMNTWPLNDFVETRVSPGDVATGMTPLGILADGGDLPGLSRMVIGFISGPCGEVSVAAALIGGGYLIWKKIISPAIPLALLGTILGVSFVYYMTAIPLDDLEAMLGTRATGAGAALYMALYQVFAGGAAFGAFFLAPAICLPCAGALFPIKVSSAVDAAYQRRSCEQSEPGDAAYQRRSREQLEHDRLERQKKAKRRDLRIQIVSGAAIGLTAIALRFIMITGAAGSAGVPGVMTEGIAAPVLIVYAVVRCCCLLRKVTGRGRE